MVKTMGEEESASLKLWATKTIFMMAILIGLSAVIQQYFGFNILVEVIISIVIILAFFFLHEYLHYYKAIKLGYEPRWYRTKLTMGFEISHHTNRKTWNKHKKEIGTFPYYFMFPLAAIILVIGLLISSLGIIITSIVIIVLHIISYFTTEGK